MSKVKEGNWGIFIFYTCTTLTGIDRGNTVVNLTADKNKKPEIQVSDLNYAKRRISNFINVNINKISIENAFVVWVDEEII